MKCPGCGEPPTLKKAKDGDVRYACEKCDLVGTWAKTPKTAEEAWMKSYFGVGLKPCGACKGKEFWVGPYGVAICMRCTPPHPDLFRFRVFSEPGHPEDQR